MDKKRPGLLSLPVSFLTSGNESNYANLSTRDAVVQAMEDLKVSMDRCFHMERQFLDKLYDPTEDEVGAEGLLQQLCVAHILLHIQNNLHSLEEWEYLRKTDIYPRFDAALDKIKTQSKATAEGFNLRQLSAASFFVHEYTPSCKEVHDLR